MLRIKRPLIVFALFGNASLLAGCGGSSDSASTEQAPADTTPPSVTSVTPAAGMTDVQRDVELTASFNEDMLGTSVSDRTVHLSLNGSDVPASVTFDGASNVATLTPEKPLSLLGHYQVTLDAAVADLSGNGLSSSVTSSFTVRDGAWGNTATPFNIQQPLDKFDVQIATDTDGNAIAAWVTAQNKPVSSRYTPEAGWSTPVDLYDNDYNYAIAGTPRVAIDNEGNATAVWFTYYNNGGYYILSNRYTKGSGWGTAVKIDDDYVYPGVIQLGFDEQGNALVIWSGRSPTNIHRVRTNRYSQQSESWGDATTIASTSDSIDLKEPQIATSADGNGFAVWVQDNAGTCTIQVSRYSADNSVWGAAQNVGPGLCSAKPQIGADGAGNAIVAWEQAESVFSIQANRYTAGEGWGTIQEIEPNVLAETYPQIAVTPKGDAMVVWRQRQPMYTGYWIRASRYMKQSNSWSQPENIDEGDSDEIRFHQVALDVDGNALALWRHVENSKDEVRAARYVAGSGWNAAVTISPENPAYTTTSLQITVDPSGAGTAFWVQTPGSDSDIYRKRFD
ncbi:Ig-like domain-containing protein [Marinobacter sp.]|uniref:Ig-like domain-containing protein n=1 Tax=Marinobacter sp. TaxID=50741 RepID=UPI002B277653|nr:Ig-like domain-containing protein [Marinobacter sp.]